MIKVDYSSYIQEQNDWALGLLKASETGSPDEGVLLINLAIEALDRSMSVVTNSFQENIAA